MKINMINDSGMELSEEVLNKWIKGIAAELLRKKLIDNEKKGKEVSLVFLSENDAKKLNWNYRCKDYPTDILSFGSDDPTSMGELVMCPQVISRQAKEHGLTLEDELGYIVLHGVLHLLGYDHEKSKVDEELMMSIQDEVFENLRNPKAAAKKAKLAIISEKNNLKVKRVVPAKNVKAQTEKPKKVSAKAAVAKTGKVASKAAPVKAFAKARAKSVKKIKNK